MKRKVWESSDCPLPCPANKKGKKKQLVSLKGLHVWTLPKSVTKFSLYKTQNIGSHHLFNPSSFILASSVIPVLQVLMIHMHLKLD